MPRLQRWTHGLRHWCYDLSLSPYFHAKGESARMSSFVGAIAIADLVKTTLGPKGMDKILQSVLLQIFSTITAYFEAYSVGFWPKQCSNNYYQWWCNHFAIRTCRKSGCQSTRWHCSYSRWNCWWWNHLSNCSMWWIITRSRVFSESTHASIDDHRRMATCGGHRTRGIGSSRGKSCGWSCGFRIVRLLSFRNAFDYLNFDIWNTIF